MRWKRRSCWRSFRHGRLLGAPTFVLVGANAHPCTRLSRRSRGRFSAFEFESETSQPLNALLRRRSGSLFIYLPKTVVKSPDLGRFHAPLCGVLIDGINQGLRWLER